jgi:TDG/mug DNA glycosylase family protein
VAAREKTLPDYLRAGLDIVSIGINPSLYSVEKGFAFARPGNRFWTVFNAARIVPAELQPGREAIETLFREHGIGFTDIVKRPTRSANELTPGDYAQGARQLKRKLLRHRPRIAWFQGKDAWKMFLEHTAPAVTDRKEKRIIALGLQSEPIGDSAVFVTPNPSGANPAANPRLLLPWYEELGRLRRRLQDGR